MKKNLTTRFSQVLPTKLLEFLKKEAASEGLMLACLARKIITEWALKNGYKK